MTYQEIFEQVRKRAESGQSDQNLDQIIESISKLPCTGRGLSTPVFRKRHVQVDVRGLDGGVELPEFGCMHCTMLAGYNWVKSAIDADRNGTPLPPMP